MKISLTITSDFERLFGYDFTRVLDAARVAEAAGIHQLDLAEHLLMGDGKSYPFGDYPAPLDEPWPEPIAMLSAIAAVTKNVRLGTGILIATLRPAALLAKQLATVDRISNGRLDIGIASGWQIEEYQGCGIPFEKRNQRMDDTIAACQALWTGERVSLKLDTVELNDVLALPPPVQTPLPIWYGGSPTQATANRIAKFGHGWVPLFLPEELLESGISLIRDAYKKHNRNPDELQVRHGLFPQYDSNGKFDLNATFEPIERLKAMGVTMVNIGMGWSTPNADDLEQTINDIGAYFKTHFGQQ